jgi:predicted nucleic acid-binding protein
MDVSHIIDTQILSQTYNDAQHGRPASDKLIASVTAKEFLLAQSIESKRPSYYVLHPAMFARWGTEQVTLPNHRLARKDAKKNIDRTDQIVIDFGGTFPPYREYSDQALTLVINGKQQGLYKLSIAPLPNKTQRFLWDRFRFLLDADYRCLAANAAIVEIGLDLFSHFIARHNCKQHVSNTINDLLIAATAIHHGLRLRTRDKLLGRFSAEIQKAQFEEQEDELVVDFSRPDINDRKCSRESKEYVNRGWSYSVRNQRSVSGS